MPQPPEIDRATIQHLAELARLHLPADQLAALRQRLERLVQAFATLQAVPLPDPAPGDADAGTPLRDDQPGAPLATAEVLANAPRTAGAAFLVPRVVDA